MSWELYLKHTDRNGTDKNPVIVPVTARYKNKVNTSTPLVFVLNSEHPAAGDFEEFDIVEVFIRNKEFGLNDYTSDFTALVTDIQYDTDEFGETWVTVTAMEKKFILSLRSIMWPSGTANRSKFSAVRAETVMKTIVQYNLLSDATVANGRWREGDITDPSGMNIQLSNETDAASGELVSGGFVGANCLVALEEVASVGGGDFEVAYDKATGFEFQFHSGQLGDDKSSGSGRVVFSLKNGTMSKPRLVIKRAVGTVVVVGGSGAEGNRVVRTVTGPDYSVTNDTEHFHDGKSQGTDTDALDFVGEVKAEEIKKSYELTFDVVQTSGVFYSPVAVSGKQTYRVGDLVTASYQVEETRKIESTTVNWRSQAGSARMQIDVETREV